MRRHMREGVSEMIAMTDAGAYGRDSEMQMTAGNKMQVTRERLFKEPSESYTFPLTHIR